MSNKRKLSENTKHYIPLYGKPSDWKYTINDENEYVELDCMQQLNKREEWYDLIVNQDGSTVEENSKIVTLYRSSKKINKDTKNISFLYYEIIDPKLIQNLKNKSQLQSIPSYQKTFHECFGFVVNFLKNNPIAYLWTTFTGSVITLNVFRIKRERKHTQAILFSKDFIDDDDTSQLQIFISDSNNAARRPMNVIINFLKLIDKQIIINKIHFVGTWGKEYDTSDMCGACYVYVYRTISRSIFSTSITPPKIYLSLDADDFFYRYKIEDSDSETDV